MTRPKVTRIGSHDIAFRPTGFGGFYSATCKTCDALLTCGFPFGFCFHTASHHAGICDCDGPSLVTWT